MSDMRKIVIYVVYQGGTWSTEHIEVLDEGIFSPEDLVFHYMEKHGDEFEGMAFYGIYHIPSEE